GAIGVAHLGGRAAAAPLFAHQAELDTGCLQDLRGGSWDGRPEEGALAVAEQDGLAPDRDTEALRPVRDVLLAHRDVTQHRFALPLGGGIDPPLPPWLVDAGFDGERTHRLDDVDRPGTEAVEVAGEQGVGAAQLACTALGAVDVVAGDVLDGQVALFHRHDVRVKRRRAVYLVPGHLHDRADLT